LALFFLGPNGEVAAAQRLTEGQFSYIAAACYLRVGSFHRRFSRTSAGDRLFRIETDAPRVTFIN